MTQQATHATQLEAGGWTRDPGSRVTRYWVYTHPATQVKVFLGRAGAFRYGRTASTSIPASPRAVEVLKTQPQRLQLRS